MINKVHTTRLIKEESHRFGFSFCGISKAEKLQREGRHLEEWLIRGLHAKTYYMEREPEKRMDPGKIFPGAKSVISVLLNYYTSKKQVDPAAPKISKYAYGNDYHDIVKNKLNLLLLFIKEIVPGSDGKVCVDTSSVMEKVWAQRSGLGWIGKNTNLINKNKGSFFFIGEIITDAELDYDSPVKDYCGSCTRCIDACPTHAIIEPYVLDSSRCISYLTIELKEKAIPEEFSCKLYNWIFGCDICQDVCPWNRFSENHHEPALEPVGGILDMNSDDWNELTEEKFKNKLSSSPLRRVKYAGLKRNIAYLTASKASCL